MKPPSLPCAPFRGNCGFTLLELLAAATVLVMLMVMVVSLVGSVAATTDHSHRRMDADASGRIALERIGIDLEKMLKRSDINYGFYKQTGDDSLCFYSATQSYGNYSRPVSVVTYRINSARQLERGVKTIAAGDWKTPIFVPVSSQVLDLQNLSGPAGITLAPSDYQNLGDDVLRFEVAYLGVNSANGIGISATAPSQFAGLRGLIVAVAVLDGKSRGLLTDAQLDMLAQQLGDAEDEKEILPIWENALSGSTGNPVVDKAMHNLRFYQRYYFFK